MAEHRVELLQLMGAGFQLFRVHARGRRHVLDLFIRMRKELVQRRIKQAHRHRQPAHHPEDFLKVRTLHGQELGQRRLTARLVLREYHLAYGDDAFCVEEHVLGAAKPDALRAEIARDLRVMGRFGVGAHGHAPDLVRPSHERCEIAGKLRLHRRDRAEEHLARRAVDGDDVALVHLPPAGGEERRALVDLQIASAAHAWPAHATRDHRRMAGHAAPRGHDRPCGVHAVNILRAGLNAHEDDVAAFLRKALGLVGVEDDLARGGARRGGQPGQHQITRRVRIKRRMQQLVEGMSVNAHHSLFLSDQPFGAQINGDLQRRFGGALAIAGLQHPQLALLDGELDILHVAIVVFELVENIRQFRIG